MKYKFITAIALLGLTSVLTVPSFAASDSIDAMARVIQFSERYVTVREVRPTEECREVTVQGSSRSTSSHTPELLGAIVGGAIGKNLSDDGKKDGKSGAIIGSLLGASIASDLEKKNAQANRSASRTEVRCTTVNKEIDVHRIDGYDVTYEYDGQLFSGQTKVRPGSEIPVRVYVLPVE